MKKIAIIGASQFQEPLIKKAKDMGLETHVFAWASGDVGEKVADFFYPISITEKEQILEKCRNIGIDGICTIASDLATITVSYVAEHMGLPGNSVETSIRSTNKNLMRQCFEEHGDPSPKSRMVSSLEEAEEYDLQFPLIVKPTDRSGSRGIYKVSSADELAAAIENAKKQSFQKKVLLEDYVEGKEYSVEYISFAGRHSFLSVTEKFTTGAPLFIETGHMEPAGLDDDKVADIRNVVEHALDSLGVTIGASHTELKIDAAGKIKLIEIGARMGGDFIGSHLVMQSTGNDYVALVIQCAMGEKPIVKMQTEENVVAVKFAFDDKDCDLIEGFVKLHPKNVLQYDVVRKQGEPVTDSSSRWGYCLANFLTREEAKIQLDLR